MRRANDIWRVLFGVPEAASRHVARDQSAVTIRKHCAHDGSAAASQFQCRAFTVAMQFRSRASILRLRPRGLDLALGRRGRPAGPRLPFRAVRVLGARDICW